MFKLTQLCIYEPHGLKYELFPGWRHRTPRRTISSVLASLLTFSTQTVKIDWTTSKKIGAIIERPWAASKMQFTCGTVLRGDIGWTLCYSWEIWLTGLINAKDNNRCGDGSFWTFFLNDSKKCYPPSSIVQIDLEDYDTHSCKWCLVSLFKAYTCNVIYQ